MTKIINKIGKTIIINKKVYLPRLRAFIVCNYSLTGYIDGIEVVQRSRRRVFGLPVVCSNCQRRDGDCPFGEIREHLTPEHGCDEQEPYYYYVVTETLARELQRKDLLVPEIEMETENTVKAQRLITFKV